ADPEQNRRVLSQSAAAACCRPTEEQLRSQACDGSGKDSAGELSQRKDWGRYGRTPWLHACDQVQLGGAQPGDIAEGERRDFHLYIDEFPSFTTTSFSGMLSEMRKYRLNLVLAHQYMAQVDETVRDAMLGNAGT